MIFVVMADFPCNVEDTIGYAEDERQQQQNLGQSHAPSLLLPKHREYAPKKAALPMPVRSKAKQKRIGKERLAACI